MREPVTWVRCFSPCAFEGKVCGRRGCTKIHTHFQRLGRGSIQDIWPVACDEHAGVGS